MSATAILFDMDGTLVDSLGDIGDSMNAVLAELGHPTHTLDAYRTLVGEGARELVRRALPHHAAHELEDALARYKARYATHLIVTSAPYAGVPAMLTALAARGVPMAVVTNKPHEAAREIVARLFAAGTFAEVLGQREGFAHKPDPSGALGVAAQLGVSPANAWFVGDTDTDMRTARAAGMRALGVTWGFRDRAELEAHGAHRIVDQPDQILEVVLGP